ncbi:hypothetical protein J2X15_002194 [Rhodoferax saidenbachensis]|uniref:Uncharacterized protein n=1 Tax=Rhodoferax saidenbachensis TaxID=1484693 RepID=A0ABU1ZN47_9BURK|nr:hypothetical protein [Rhodoferax saidenbachensis]
MDIQNNADSATVIASTGCRPFCARTNLRTSTVFTADHSEPHSRLAWLPLQNKRQRVWTGT